MISKKAAPNWATVQTLQDIAEKVTTAHGWTCKPAGDEWLYIVIDMARAILDAGILDVITPADLEQLTAENFHTVRHAAEMLLTVAPYRIPGTTDGPFS